MDDGRAGAVAGEVGIGKPGETSLGLRKGLLEGGWRVMAGFFLSEQSVRKDKVNLGRGENI